MGHGLNYRKVYCGQVGIEIEKVTVGLHSSAGTGIPGDSSRYPLVRLMIGIKDCGFNYFLN